MEQLTQKLKSGAMRVLEVPIPLLCAGHVLVRNHYSLVSAGTESSTVKAARKGYIGKAKERPQQVKQVIESLKTQGIAQTYRAVMKKLDSYSPLGYSCAGEVLEAAPDVTGFRTGDLVACGGFTASHSEIVSVPINLCVKLDPDADLRQAAFNTLGAIALQGIRQADLRLGESCAVIGLGLLGQITSLLLRASGVRAAGIDIDPGMVDIAREHCVDLGLVRSEGALEQYCRDFSSHGFDAVIITAASESLDPINLAGAICRKKGTIVVVGAVPTGFDREPHFYKKELQVRMSCSYGPGRYDVNYEEKGLDYPVAYVRWSENRNMQAFQDLLRSKKIAVDYLVTHTFKLSEAPAAYDMIMARDEPFIGILIEYDRKKEVGRTRIELRRIPGVGKKEVSIGFIGAGSYALSHLLPNLHKRGDARLRGVMTSTGINARSVADRFGFEFCTTNLEDIIRDESIDTVFIATRHDTHAELVLEALRNGKNVFVEKPLCINESELTRICHLYGSLPEGARPLLMVGYNRRFAPFAAIIKSTFGSGPFAMSYRVNSGSIPADSWIQDREAGGGRIVGEVCHFVDLLSYFCGSPPVSVYASAMRDRENPGDTVSASLTFSDGSVGSICYFSNGDKSLPKERIEVFAMGAAAVLEDFQKLSIHARGAGKVKKLLSQDKGQKAEVNAFIDSILAGKEAPIPFSELVTGSLATFRMVDSIRTGKCVGIGVRDD